MEQLFRPLVEKPLQLKTDSPALHLIQQVRDEATALQLPDTAQKGKIRTASMLEEITGVGEKRRRNLLARFGGLKGVQQASVEELARVEESARHLQRKFISDFINYAFQYS